MTRLYYAFLEAAIASVPLVPVLLLLNRTKFHSTKATLLYFPLCIYLCGLYAVTGLPNIHYIRFSPNINLIPFAGMISDLTNVCLNVLLFVPFGLFLPVLWPGFRSLRSILFGGFGLSLTIECLQMLTGRATDINDLFVNTAGCILGFCFGTILCHMIPAIKQDRQTHDLSWLILCSFCVMFLFQPAIWGLIY